MADEFQLGIPSASSGDLSWLLLPSVLGAVALGVGLFILLVVGSKYPVVNFIGFDGKRMVRRKKRLISKMIVDDNLLNIVINGSKLHGDSIDEYDYIFDRGKQTYICVIEKGKMMPLKLKNNELNVEDYLFAQDITIRYINMRESVKDYIDKSNPLISAIISVIPNASIIILFGLSMYFVLNATIPPLSNAVSTFSANMLLASDNFNKGLELQNQTLTKIDVLYNTISNNNTFEYQKPFDYVGTS